ncbi:MAG: FMN-binding glutamate synthase family protein [Gammaproteobacteria bacterium]|nr:FMN-binding glutamate synthase family protein [Gammaproteobacteria bacterium]
MQSIANWLIIIFTGAFVLGLITLAVMYWQDVHQTTHAIRRNYPVIGRMRYRFERLGEYFRQYFFANDREEQPFNRAMRSWVYRTAKGLGGLISFGSTHDLNQPGAYIFVNASFPKLEEEKTPMPPITIGARCDKPYVAKHAFNISGMSYGAISKPAVRALACGAAKAGIWLNTGEGGLSPYHTEFGTDVIFQIGTAKYGVRDAEGRLDPDRLREVGQQVQAFEVKLSQGAKPGRGGVLPGIKVTEEIARIRGIPAGKTSSSPNRHRDVANTQQLLELMHYIRGLTGRPVGFKAVYGSELFPRELCETIHRLGIDYAPDFITVDGGEGGTGAAPQVLADHVGLSLSESLPMVVNTLTEYDLRDQIRVIASGKLVTSGHVAWALCVGADFAVTARGFMFALGCIQSLQCHKDTCPTGITTHNPRLQKGLVVEDKAERVASYAHWVNHEINELAHSCGLSNAREFQREHLRIVQKPGYSMPLSELYPEIRITSLIQESLKRQA